MKRLLGVFVLLTAILESRAYGCTCVPPLGISEAVAIQASAQSSKAVFVGTVVANDRKTPIVVELYRELWSLILAAFGKPLEYREEDYGRVVRFRINTDIKNAAQQEVDVRTGFGGGDCGFQFDVGKVYLVYADGSNELHASICSRTASLQNARQEVEVLLKDRLTTR